MPTAAPAITRRTSGTWRQVLRATAARLQQTVGPQHTVARLGGDEFTVVLENLDTPDVKKVLGL